MKEDEKIMTRILDISKESESKQEYLDRARQLKKDLTFYDDIDAEQEIEMIWIISNEENRQCHI
jgi:hypothetical protein